MSDKLIAVGMRYQNAADVSEVVKAVRSRMPGDTAVHVELELTNTTEGVNGKGIMVKYKGKQVAWVRNKDLNNSVFQEFSLTAYRTKIYYIHSVYDNYWVLLKASNMDIANYYSGVVTSANIANSSISINNSNTICQPVQQNTVKKEETKMAINTNSMRDNFFREVKNVAIDIQSGKFGVLNADGLSVYDNGGVSVNPIQDFGVKVPAFAFRIAINDLKEGDIILNGNDASFFKAKNDKGYEVVTLNGEVKQVGSVSNMFFGKNTVLAVRNMFGEGMNPMMMALMLGDKSDGFDMKTFALMSMMGGNAVGMDNNMLMMAMLMGK